MAKSKKQEVRDSSFPLASSPTPTDSSAYNNNVNKIYSSKTKEARLGAREALNLAGSLKSGSSDIPKLTKTK